jgi:hypothetical protein
MRAYEIEQYELWTTKYRVEAASEAKAVAKLFAGKAQLVEESHELVEVADDYGLPVDENRDIADELEELGISVGDDVIPSIRSVEEI